MCGVVSRWKSSFFSAPGRHVVVAVTQPCSKNKAGYFAYIRPLHLRFCNSLSFLSCTTLVYEWQLYYIIRPKVREKSPINMGDDQAVQALRIIFFLTCSTQKSTMASSRHFVSENTNVHTRCELPMWAYRSYPVSNKLRLCLENVAFKLCLYVLRNVTIIIQELHEIKFGIFAVH